MFGNFCSILGHHLLWTAFATCANPGESLSAEGSSACLEPYLGERSGLSSFFSQFSNKAFISQWPPHSETSADVQVSSRFDSCRFALHSQWKRHEK